MRTSPKEFIELGNIPQHAFALSLKNLGFLVVIQEKKVYALGDPLPEGNTLDLSKDIIIRTHSPEACDIMAQQFTALAAAMRAQITSVSSKEPDLQIIAVNDPELESRN